VADEGYIDACAAELLRYRKALGAEQIAVFADIKKKHSAHSITADVSIGETAAAAEFFRADGLIITGTATGKSAELHDLTEAKKHSKLPIIIGSGITDHIDRFWDYADGFIIGSYLKEEGVWSNPISEQRCLTVLEKVKSIR
jgi:predicted TIM-barrel enzyme